MIKRFFHRIGITYCKVLPSWSTPFSIRVVRLFVASLDIQFGRHVFGIHWQWLVNFVEAIQNRAHHEHCNRWRSHFPCLQSDNTEVCLDAGGFSYNTEPPTPMSKHSTIEIYKADNKEFCWRRRATNGRLLSGPVETFKSRAAVANNLSANFGLCLTREGVQTLARQLPFEPGDPSVFIKINTLTVEIKGPTAPRRPRTHTEHARKATAVTLK